MNTRLIHAIEHEVQRTIGHQNRFQLLWSNYTEEILQTLAAKYGEPGFIYIYKDKNNKIH